MPFVQPRGHVRPGRSALLLTTGAALVLSLAPTPSAQVSFEVVADLSSLGAYQPMGGLTRGPDGALYGTTAAGGAGNCGTIYRLTAGGAVTVLYSFTNGEACYPVGDLTVGPDEHLYGTTYFGGDAGLGTVYKVTLAGTFTRLHSFSGSPDGASPYAGLTAAPNGLLYGTAFGGGVGGGGVIFTISSAGSFQIVTQGVSSHAALTVGSDGFLYGTTAGLPGNSAGSVFRIDLAGNLTTLHSFPYVVQSNPPICPEGAQLLGEVVEGPDGNFYGTTSLCGPTPESAGTVFRMTPAGNVTTLHAFTRDGAGLATNGGEPWTGLTLGADGNLYGATIAGGPSSQGILFRITPAGEFTLLRSFTGSDDGGGPQEGRLLEASPGVFYGVSTTNVFTLTVNDNNAPVAQDGAIATDEDVSFSGGLLATDADSQPLTYSVVTNGAQGTATITDATTGTFTYTPNANVSGTDTFTFRATDGSADSNVATVTVTIQPVNDAPVVYDNEIATAEDTVASAVLAVDDDGSSLTFSIVANGAKGTAVLTDASTGAFSYTPQPNVSGSDNVTFQASDGTLSSNIASVAVTISPVNDAPVPQTGVVSTSEGTSVGGVLAATDPEGDPIVFGILVPPSQGTATIVDAAAGTFFYTPNPGAIGYDTFTFSVQDAAGEAATGTQMMFVVANGPRWPGQTMRATVSSAGSQGTGDSFNPMTSANGRFVVFSSESSQLVSGDTNGRNDVFVHDRQSAQTHRISVASDGTQANQVSLFPAISADGRLIAFTSVASNLVPGDTNSTYDVFVHDRATGLTTRVSVATDGAQANGESGMDNFQGPALSADARFVAFSSAASNLVQGDTNGTRDVFVHDRATGVTTRASVATGGAQVLGQSYFPSISADGRFVSFASEATTLISGDTNARSDAFVHDRSTGLTSRVSVGNGGVQANGHSGVSAISADGRVVAFRSSASNLVEADSNAVDDIFVHDCLSGQTTRVSQSSAGAPSDASSDFPVISADGRYVAFASRASTLVAGDTNGRWDVFVRDRLTSGTTMVSVGGDGSPGLGETFGSSPSISSDGRFIGVQSGSNFVPDDTNAVRDIYVVGGVSVTPSQEFVPSAGAQGAVNVEFAYPGTQWNATSDSTWISITDQSSSSGSGTVSYTVEPNTKTVRSGTLTIAAQPVRIAQEGATAPVAQDGTLATMEDTIASGTLLASDPNGDALVFSLAANSTLGTVVVTNPATGAFTYTPTANVSGTDTFTFQASDGASISNVATVSVTITPVNDAPVAVGGILSTDEDTPVSGTLSASDVDSPALAFSIVANGTKGTAVLTNPSSGAFTYTPNPDANGADAFTFKASDGTFDSNLAIVTVTITPADDAPRAQAGAVTTPEGTAVAGQLLAVDPDGGPVSFSVVDQPSKGTVVVTDAAAGTFTYTPNPTAIGFDPFTFQASDGTTSTVATQAVVVVASSPRWPGQTVLASASQGFGQDTSVVRPALSADGRFVAMESASSSLVPGDTNGVTDVFVLDRQTQQMSRVSLSTTSEQGNGPSLTASLSADGQVIAFVSLATNLVPEDRNGRADVFVKDRRTGQTTRVSVSTGGQEANSTSQYPTVSANGRFVAFQSFASNIVADDHNGQIDVFVHDRETGTTIRASLGPDGSEGDSSSLTQHGLGEVVSADGRYVAFFSGATNFGGGPGGVFLRDTLMGSTTRVGSGATPSLTPDGRFVAYSSSIATGTNVLQVSVYDRVIGMTDLIALPTAAGSERPVPAISADGRFVAVTTALVLASDPEDVNNVEDVFVHDRISGRTVRVSVDSAGGSSTFGSTAPRISSDGRFVVFTSAGTFTPGDTDALADVFVVGGVSVSPTSSLVGAEGGATSIDVSFVYPGTPWSASSENDWLTVGSQSSTNGTGTVAVTVTPNTGVARTGTLTVAAQVVTVAQAEAAPLSLTLSSPNGGEKVFANVPTTFHWSHAGIASAFNLELSRNSGGTYTPITACTGLPGSATSCAWTPTGPSSSTARLRVTAVNDATTVTDASDSDFTISTAVPSITVTAPNTALSWVIGATQNIRWNHNLGLLSFVRVELSRNGGGSWETLAASYQNTGATSSTFPWVVSGPASAAALVRVSRLDGPTTDVSNVAFSIVRPSITVTAPNTAVTWSVGSTRAITWTHNLAPGQLVNIEVSRDGGSSWSAIASGVTNATATTGSFTWVVSGPATSTARARVSWAADSASADASNVDFSIVAPSITVTSPNTVLTRRVASTLTLRFTHNLGSGQPVAFEISRDGGTTWSPVVEVVTGTSTTVTHQWLVTGPPTSQARIRARWVSDPTVSDVSDVSFVIIPRITVTAPNTAVTFGAGSTRTVTWTHNLGVAETVDIAFSADAGGTWTTIASGVVNASATSGSWTGPMPAIVSTQGFVRVSQSSDPASFDTNDVPFTLAPPTITVTAPNTNVNWTIGSNRSIAWTHNLGTAERVQVELSRDGGVTWALLAADLASSGNTSGTLGWLVTGPASAAARVRVAWVTDGSVQDISNVNFRIQ